MTLEKILTYLSEYLGSIIRSVNCVPKENGISKDKDTPTATETNVHTLAKTVELDDRIAALEKLVGTAHGQNFEDL
ncbi:3577_t:CDS:2, partial [Entrophospora sp. SA101]